VHEPAFEQLSYHPEGERGLELRASGGEDLMSRFCSARGRNLEQCRLTDSGSTLNDQDPTPPQHAIDGD
jgi:hypothetical protein